MASVFAFLVMVTFVPPTSVTASVAPLIDFTTCPAAIIALVTPPGAMPRVMSPLVPPPVNPGPAMIDRTVPKRKAISNPVESLLCDDTSDPASTTCPSPPAWVASTLPCTMVPSTTELSPMRRCSYAARLWVELWTTVPLASRTRSVTEAALPDDSTRKTL
jgi:hypothetical protein